nr:MAG TPA: hypothetical protein [Caudoviricetes sp.]
MAVIFQSHPDFRGGRNANTSEIWAQLTIRYRKISREHCTFHKGRKTTLS